MDDLTIARVLHIIAVLFWVGGVAFVTFVLLPWVRRSHAPMERLRAFHSVEQKFAPQARAWVILAGLSGLWMIYRAELWSRFADPRAWWMHMMVAVWLVFSCLLFIAEPLVLHHRMETSPQPDVDFYRLELGHRFLLAISVLAVVGGVGGSHGLF